VIRIDEVIKAFEGREPRLLDDPALGRAAVSFVLHERPSGLHVLLIERAKKDGDPWSGQIALPGGKADAGDADLRATAEREGREEVGLDYGRAKLLGRLDDLHAFTRPVSIASFVYQWPGEAGPGLVTGAEVTEAFWVDLETMLDSARQMRRKLEWQGRSLDLPAIAVLRAGRPVMWGLTYRLMESLFDVLGRPLPHRSDA
jgi:8-oxo-dGTP pyrophosphatase MutT (NUDIX family)